MPSIEDLTSFWWMCHSGAWLRILAQLDITSGCWHLAHILLLCVLLWFSGFVLFLKWTHWIKQTNDKHSSNITNRRNAIFKLFACSISSWCTLTRTSWIQAQNFSVMCYFDYYTFKVLKWNSQTFQLCVWNAPLNQFSAFNPVTGKPLIVSFKGRSEAMMSYQWNTNPLNTPLYPP